MRPVSPEGPSAPAAPNATHRACVEGARAVGKHPWCEKPMARMVPDGPAVCAVAWRAAVRRAASGDDADRGDFAAARSTTIAAV